MFSFYLLDAKKIFGFLKKTLIVIAVYFIVISLFLHFINKSKPKIDYNPVEKNRQEIYKVINDPKLKNTQEGKIAITLYRGMFCVLIGEACTDNPKDGDKNFNHSVFGFVTNLIVLPYANPPASGIYWAYSGLQNAGFVPKTYAAEGIGFAAIKPFMSLWKIFRNISYMILVLIIITIGFMIMFRTKINPQTVISVENSLPKIIIAIILITFSFPIAGFLIDIMYVINLLIISLLSSNIFKGTEPIPKEELISNYLNPSLGQIFPPGFNLLTSFGVGTSLFNVLPEELRIIITPFLNFLAGIFSMWIITNIIGGSNGKPAANIGEAISNITAGGFTFGKLPRLIALFVDVGLFFMFALFGVPFLLGIIVLLTIILIIFRIFFILLKNYIEIILMIIFSPIILLLEGIPGKNTFFFWLKNIFANLLSFVVVITLILIAGVINHISYNITNQQSPWAPPFIYGLNGKTIGSLIGVGIFILIPDFIKLTKEFLGAKGLQISAGPGMFFASVGAILGGTKAGLGAFTSFSQTPFIGPWLQKRAKVDDSVGRFLKGFLGPSQPEMFAQVLGEVLNKKGENS